MEIPTCKIYCCTHVNTNIVDKELYTLLQTGRAYDKYVVENAVGDDTGENISNKKDEYDGFLTGMYWIWKNTTEDVKGICGYRSFFKNEYNEILLADDIKLLFDKYDFIATRIKFEVTVEEQFRTVHKDFYNNYLDNPMKDLRCVIEKNMPEYLEALDFVLSGHYMNYRHMFIAKRKYFDGYCKWLFKVLEYYKIFLNEKNYAIKPRFYGYVAERLLRVWLVNNEIKVKELPILLLERG